MKDSSIFLPGGSTGVLLIHRLGGAPAELNLVARAIHAAGHTVFCCELAGHCGDEGDLLASDWHSWYGSAQAALAKLERSCKTIVVGGQSMGAILALHLAADYGERVRGAMLFGPTLFYDGWSVPWYGRLLRIAARLPFGRNYRVAEQYPYGVKDTRMRTGIIEHMARAASAEVGLSHIPGRSLAELWRMAAQLKRKLRHITIPALIVHAREDDLASLRSAFFLQQRLGGRVEALVLEDSYHRVTLDRQRHRASAAAIRFISELTPEDEEQDLARARAQ